ncbi:unnamed protein product [Symbiodinium natans]|uniref:PPM-type phosphatase domain-containing protein n=1 Tax=Symbiodinium natans TaxID=878477 RepID=A0A812NBP9_9DINO|nr:unnamed protein product [Symbiodinium natans]
MGNICCLGREKPSFEASSNTALPARSVENVVLLRRPAPPQPPGLKEALASETACKGTTGESEKPDLKEALASETASKSTTDEAEKTARTSVSTEAETPDLKEAAASVSDQKALAEPNAKALTQEALDEVFSTQALFFVRGLMSKGQRSGEEREWAAFGDAGPFQPDMISCQKGDKGKASEPNQDNFSITRLSNGYSLAVICDGHGKKGHQAATRAAQSIPFFVMQLALDGEQVEEAILEKALISAFEKADEDLQQHAAYAESGCTAVAALWTGRKVWTAHTGDSRCLLLKDQQVIFSTEDHKPSCVQERRRVEESGGEVRSLSSDDVPRVFFPGQIRPGLAMTRALGDNSAKGCGIIATPQVHHTCMDMGQAAIVLASDGVWEVVQDHEVPALVCESFDTAKLQSEALTRWASLTGGQYRDDVTSIVVPLI